MSNKSNKTRNNLQDLLNKYDTYDVVSQIESNLNQNIPQEVYLNEINLSPLINKNYYNIDALYSEEIEIKNYGIVEPLLICKDLTKEKTYTLLNGTKRYLLLKKLKNEKAKVSIIENIEQKMVDEFILLNLVKNNDGALIIGYALKKFKEKYNIKSQDLALISGLSTSQVLNLIRILDLSTKCIKALKNNEVEYTKVRPLLSISKDLQDSCLNEILTKNLSVREIESMVSQLNKPESNKTTIKLTKNQITITLPTQKDAKELYKELNIKYKLN